MFRIDFDDAVKQVLGAGGPVTFKRHYQLDVKGYSWVEIFVRDQKTRKEIERLQEEITATQKSLIDREELRLMFKTGLDQVKRDFLELLKDHLSQAQRRESAVVRGLRQFGAISNDLLFMPITLVSDGEIGDIIAGLPVGVKRSEIEKTVEGIKKEIEKLKETIDKELSPQERWFYSDTGKPIPYPKGCRWFRFVGDWKRVVSRFDGKVDIEGCALKTEAEFEAFYLLELDKVRKLTPLRTPWEK